VDSLQIFELGIIANSVSILTCQDKNCEFGDFQSSDLRNSMLDAILKMNSVIWSQDIQSFNLRKYKIIVLVKNPKTSSFLFYCVGDTKLNVKFIKSVLERVSIRFFEQFPDVIEANTYPLNLLKKFNPVLSEIIKNLHENQTRKLKSVI